MLQKAAGKAVMNAFCRRMETKHFLEFFYAEKGSFTLNQSSNQTIALDAGSTPTNMVTTDTAQDITASKSFTGNANIYVQSGATYTASDTMITNRMISASQISGSQLMN